MKVISIVAAGVCVALIILTLVPSAGEYRPSFAVGALICSAVALATILLGWREPSVTAGAYENQKPPTSRRSVEAVVETQPRSTVAVPTIAPPVVAPVMPAPSFSGEAEVVGFLATLQEKGRLIDFLQDDITGYSDAQVGAAARVVHQGCKAVLNEYVPIVSVRSENEGSTVDVPAGYGADEYRLVGKLSGEAPFRGTLMHRGWKVKSVNLPRVLRSASDRLPVIAPAEVELR